MVWDIPLWRDSLSLNEARKEESPEWLRCLTEIRKVHEEED